MVAADGSPTPNHGSPAGSNVSDNSSIMFTHSHSQSQSHTRGSLVTATAGLMRRSAGMRVLESIDEGVHTEGVHKDGVHINELGGDNTRACIQTNKAFEEKNGFLKLHVVDGLDDGFEGDIIDEEGTTLRVIGSPSSWSTPSNSPPRAGINTPYQHTLSMHPIHPPYQHTLSTHPLNTPYQPTLLTQPLNAPSQHTLSTHTLNTPTQHILSTHPLNAPSQPTL